MLKPSILQQLCAWLPVGTGFALMRGQLLFLALTTMGCLVTDKIDFRVSAPSVRDDYPPTVSRLPSVPDSNCEASGGYREFGLVISDVRVDQPLHIRVLSNGALVTDSISDPTGEVVRKFSECLREGDFSPGCNRVEVVVSHGLQSFMRDSSPAQPVVEGDADRVTWWVAVEPDLPDPTLDVFQACIDRAAVSDAHTQDAGVP